MNPSVSELRLVSSNFAPRGWALANGQLLAINQNQALFSLVGTTYGGNGMNNFALPDLQGRAPLHQGTGFSLGQLGGETAHTLQISEMPQHIHSLQGINVTQNVNNPGNAFLANTGPGQQYQPSGNLVPMFSGDIGGAGGSQPHPNQSPYLVMTWIIALQGIFPSRN
jgi:microcystin-dependent protein